MDTTLYMPSAKVTKPSASLGPSVVTPSLPSAQERRKTAVHKDRHPASLLRQRKSNHKVANNEQLLIAPLFVPDNWKRLSHRDQSSLKQNLKVRLQEHLKLENSMLGLQSTLNFLAWMWDSALQELREFETRDLRCDQRSCVSYPAGLPSVCPHHLDSPGTAEEKFLR